MTIPGLLLTLNKNMIGGAFLIDELTRNAHSVQYYSKMLLMLIVNPVLCWQTWHVSLSHKILPLL